MEATAKIQLEKSPTIDDFTRVNEMAFALSGKAISEGREFVPTILAVQVQGGRKYQLTIVEVGSIDADKRERVLWLQEALCNSGKADIAAFVSEAWVVQGKAEDGGKSTVVPSEHGDRKECVVVSMVSRDCQLVACHMVDRATNQLLRGEIVSDGLVAGRLAKTPVKRH